MARLQDKEVFPSPLEALAISSELISVVSSGG
jgi:hypothetical protein